MLIEQVLDSKEQFKNRITSKITDYYNKHGNILDAVYYEIFKPNCNYVLTRSRYDKSRYILTVKFLFPKIFLAQFNTHRTLSRNAASSRAVSFERFVSNIFDNFYYPIFTTEKRGMQGDVVNDLDLYLVYLDRHLNILFSVLESIRSNFSDFSLHKQNINRYLEPFALVPVIATGNIFVREWGWDHFVYLRYSKEAQTEISMLGRYVSEIKKEDAKESEIHSIYPIKEDVFLHYKLLNINAVDLIEDMTVFAKIARVSTMTESSSIEKDKKLTKKLIESGHMSPFEHVCKSAKGDFYNLKGFVSMRYIVEKGF